MLNLYYIYKSKIRATLMILRNPELKDILMPKYVQKTY